jgi:iron complex outermembrane receptor protein
MKIVYTTFLLILYFLNGNVLFSQVDSIVSTLDEVTITQDRIQLRSKDQNRSIRIISKEVIRSSPYITLPEMLQNVAGIDIRRRGIGGVQSDVVMRGGNFEQVLILINGIRMNDAQTGHHSMYLPIDIQQIERIEVLKGGASRSYGFNAYSGVVNIITKIEDHNLLSGEINYGSFNTLQTSVHGHLVSNRVKQSLNLGYHQSDGYRYNTDYRILNTYYQAETMVNGHKINLSGGFTERKFGANGFYASPDYKDQYEEVQTSVIAITSVIKANQNTTWRPKLSWRRNQDMYLFVRNNPSLYRNLHIGNNLNGEIHLQYNNRVGTFGAGIDVSRQSLHSNNLGDRLRTIYGLFAEQNVMALNNKISITGGLYGQYIDDIKKFNLYPGLDVGYQIHPSWRLTASTGYHNRVPSYTDLYYKSPSEQGNSNLKAESAWESEAGVKYHGDKFTFGITAFKRSSHNTIDWGKDSINQKAWIVNNLTDVTINGIESHVTLPITKRTSLNVQYTFLSNDVSSNTISRYILDHLKHQLNLNFKTGWLDNKLRWTSNARYNVRNTPPANLEGYSDHFVIDSKLEYTLKSLNFGITINNMTNANYRETGLVPMPGRWISGSVRFLWK